MNISILGSGNVATLLSKAFIKVGHTIDAVYSRNIEHAQTLAEAIGCPRAINHTDLLPKSDIYLFALKDDSLASVIQQLSQNIHARECSTLCISQKRSVRRTLSHDDTEQRQGHWL